MVKPEKRNSTPSEKPQPIMAAAGLLRAATARRSSAVQIFDQVSQWDGADVPTTTSSELQKWDCI